MEALTGANPALRVLRERGALVAIGYGGFATGDGCGMKLLLGRGLPLLVIIVRVLVVAPSATATLAAAAKVLLGFAILGCSARTRWPGFRWRTTDRLVRRRTEEVL